MKPLKGFNLALPNAIAGRCRFVGQVSTLWCVAALVAGAVGSAASHAQISSPDVSPDAESLVREVRELLVQTEEVSTRDELAAIVKQINDRVDEIKAIRSDHPWLPYISGRLNILVGRRAEARDQLRQFLDSREGRAEWSAHRFLGDLFAEEFPRLGLTHYETALSLKPGDAGVLLGLSLCHQKLANLAEAAKFAEQAVKADQRRRPRFMNHYAVVLHAQRKMAEAELEARSALDAARQKMIKQPAIRESAELVDLQLKLLIDVLQARIAENPKAAKPYVDFAAAQRDRTDLRILLRQFDTLTILEAGIKATKPDTTIDLLIAYTQALADVGKRNEAIIQIDAILERDPENAEARNLQSRMQR